MIEATNISKNYGAFKAVSDINFKVDKKDIVGFLGVNGAGKTTVMDIIAGYIGPDMGTVKISGYDIVDDFVNAKKNIGYLPESPPVYNDMSVKEYLIYCARLKNLKSKLIYSNLEYVLESLFIKDMANRLIGHLSKGYKQRVAFAQALIHKPSVLILDEPTDGLDPNQIVHIRNFIKSLKGKYTIILSSHLLSEIQHICDYLILIDKGKIIKQASYKDFITNCDNTISYDIKVRRNQQNLYYYIKNKSEIDNIIIKEDNIISFDFNSKNEEKVLNDILEIVLSNKNGLISLNKVTNNLEDVFVKLTKGI